MSDWRHKILQEFTPGIQPITLVSDPDHLFTEPVLTHALDEKGFDILAFEDSISFRFAYESRFRLRMDRGEQVDLVILDEGDGASAYNLPFDVYHKARQLTFSLSDFFPHLAYPVLREVLPQHLDILHEAQQRFVPGELGENATKDFVLRHVYEIAAELIKLESDLLSTLLRRHYRFESIPSVFLDRLVTVLSQGDRFREWPMRELLGDRSLLFAFLQERWPRFLARIDGTAAGGDWRPIVKGPADIPFDDPDVRVYVDSLFLEGMLQPTRWPVPLSGWASVGVIHDSDEERLQRLSILVERVENQIPAEDARYEEWLRYARTWAEVLFLAADLTPGTTIDLDDRISAVRDQVDLRFIIWLERWFGSLHNLPITSPPMVHHIARFLESRLRELGKVALVVVDGMAYHQWLILRQAIGTHAPSWRFDEGATFAWIPSLTNVSRQAIFAGKAPYFFPSSIGTTDRDGVLWQQFWVEHGLSTPEVSYLRGLGELSTLQRLDDALAVPRLKAMALVVDTVDRIMHGMELVFTCINNRNVTE